jgi:hypothetical protein
LLAADLVAQPCFRRSITITKSGDMAGKKVVEHDRMRARRHERVPAGPAGCDDA